MKKDFKNIIVFFATFLFENCISEKGLGQTAT